MSGLAENEDQVQKLDFVTAASQAAYKLRLKDRYALVLLIVFIESVWVGNFGCIQIKGRAFKIDRNVFKCFA